MPTTTTRRKQVNEYEVLRQRLELADEDCTRLFGHAGRTARRYRYGEGEPPLSTIKLMRLMAAGVLTRRQVDQA
jgi:methyl coenzyme M reductase gamma subunit